MREISDSDSKVYPLSEKPKVRSKEFLLLRFICHEKIAQPAENAIIIFD